MKQLTKSNQLIGKTIKEIKGVEGDDLYYNIDGMIIIFDDETFVSIDVDYGYESSDSLPQISEDALSDYNKLQLNFITQSDYDTYENQKRDNRAKQAEEHERSEYERLKAKFNE